MIAVVMSCYHMINTTWIVVVCAKMRHQFFTCGLISAVDNMDEFVSGQFISKAYCITALARFDVEEVNLKKNQPLHNPKLRHSTQSNFQFMSYKKSTCAF